MPGHFLSEPQLALLWDGAVVSIPQRCWEDQRSNPGSTHYSAWSIVSMLYIWLLLFDVKCVAHVRPTVHNSRCCFTITALEEALTALGADRTWLCPLWTFPSLQSRLRSTISSHLPHWATQLGRSDPDSWAQAFNKMRSEPKDKLDSPIYSAIHAFIHSLNTHRGSTLCPWYSVQWGGKQAWWWALIK